MYSSCSNNVLLVQLYMCTLKTLSPVAVVAVIVIITIAICFCFSRHSVSKVKGEFRETYKL